MNESFLNVIRERLESRYAILFSYDKGSPTVSLHRPVTGRFLTSATAETHEKALLICLTNRLVGEQE